jgi:hypothetical protein
MRAWAILAGRHGRFPLTAARGAALSLVCQAILSSGIRALRQPLEFVMLLSILMLAAGALAAVGVFVANGPVGDNDPFGM